MLVRSRRDIMETETKNYQLEPGVLSTLGAAEQAECMWTSTFQLELIYHPKLKIQRRLHRYSGFIFIW